MRRRLTALLLCLALCLLPTPRAGAHDEAGEHWKEIRYDNITFHIPLSNYFTIL